MEGVPYRFEYETIEKRTNAQQRVIKHWGLGGWAAFAPVSGFVSADTDAPRKPQRFIPATVGSKVRKPLRQTLST